MQVNSNGAVDNNGGMLHLYAPDNVVRVDGNIDVSAIRNAQAAYLGNGGKVFIDSAYLFQNGNIYANGVNGGLVQANVGAMTLGSCAQIQAKGSTGAGGVVAVNASGPINLRQGSIIDTSGKLIGSFDTNLINIEGSVVNQAGTLRADGVSTQTEGSRGGTIRLVASGQTDLQSIANALQQATVKNASDSQPPTLSIEEKLALLSSNQSLSQADGDIVITGHVTTNGSQGPVAANNDYTQEKTFRAGDGGTIIMDAMRNITVKHATPSTPSSPLAWLIQANGGTGASGMNIEPVVGGNGGTISLTAGRDINYLNGIQANGGNGGSTSGNCRLSGANAGSGGLIALGYRGNVRGYALTRNSDGVIIRFESGVLEAVGAQGGHGYQVGGGGNGGMIDFSGDTNPINDVEVFGGSIYANAGEFGRDGNVNPLLGGKPGIVIGPDPQTLSGTATFGWIDGKLTQGLVLQTQPVELLTHAENLIMLTKNGGNINVSENLFDRLLQARIRSVTDPIGSLGQAQAEVIVKNTASSPYVYRNLILGSSRNNLALDMTHPFISPAGGPGELFFPSPLSKGEGFSTLNTLSIQNNGSVSTQFLPGEGADGTYHPTNFWLIGRNSNPLGGGRISLLANGDVNNLNVFGTTGVTSGGSVNIATTGTLNNEAPLTTSSPLHGGDIIVKAGKDIINDERIYYATGQVTANGGMMGGTISLLPQHDFNYVAGPAVSGVAANGNLQGGIININAGHDSIISAGENTSPDTLATVTANGHSSTLGRGGFIHINAANNNIHDGVFQANGGLKNGTVLFTVGQ